jgi:hypothetical protein
VWSANPADYSTRQLSGTGWVCACETGVVTLREECRLMVFQSAVLRKMLVPEREKITEDNIMKRIMICTPGQMILRRSDGRTCYMHGRDDIHTECVGKY